MLKARYYDVDGKEVGAEELPAGLYDGVVNEEVLHQVVTAYMANQRQGTGSAKNRSAARGGSRKPWRQKGTGRARQGTIRAPQWAGGGRAFPPIPKSWRQDLPKKVKALARRSAHNARAGDERVVLVDALELEAPKTRRIVEWLASIDAEGKILVLTDGIRENLYLSSRNLQEVQVMPFGEESAYDLLWATTVVIERTALEGVPTEPPVKKWPRDEEAVAEREKRRAEKKAAAEKKKAEAEKAAAEKAAARKAKAEKAAAEEKAAEKKEKAAAKKEAAEEEAAPEKEAAAEKEPAPEKAEAPEIPELPTVKELADFLADVDDPAVVKGMQAKDERKTAQAHYERRLKALEEEEGSDA